MEVTITRLREGAGSASGTAVIIDVFRAFTCAPLLFSRGIERLVMVATPEEALALKRKDPSLLIVGEVGGAQVKGFDLGNSPSQIIRQPVSFYQGRTAVQRTSAGVQGVLAALDSAEEVLLGSYALAGVTAAYLRGVAPERVTLVAMGTEGVEIAPEDEACACYIAHLLDGRAYDHFRAIAAIATDESARKFLRGDRPHYPPEDLLFCLQRDAFDFILRARRQGREVEVQCHHV